MADPPPQPSEGSAQADAPAVKLSRKAVARAERAAQKERAKAERAAQKERAKAERLAEKARAREERQQVKSLAKIAEAKILKDLTSSLETHARSATFACGGNVSFKVAPAEATEEKIDVPTEQEPGAAKVESPDKAVIDDPAEQESNTTSIPKADTAVVEDIHIRFGLSGSGVTVIFNKDGPSSKDFEHLLKACQPASFGRAGEAVLDEKYRKAGKLDRSQFATTFCPYEAGIVDVVTQLLVPQHKHGKHTRSIKAELYKLNVYSAPNGKFKPHVDTPRSKDQIGSLVVSLPSAHEGGQLTVSNTGAAGQSIVFDWSTTDDTAPAEIKWAAFYSDCEHEVHEVTSGHRVTLTYNLFLSRGAGHLAGSSPALDSTQLPLYEGLQTALENPRFLRRGRVLAVYLTHCYTHTSAHVNFLPDSLKGADMSLWNTARALDLQCRVVPIMPGSGYYDEEEGYCHRFESTFGRFGQGQDMGDYGDDSWGQNLPERKVTWLNDNGDRSVGAKKFREVQTAYMTYGNEPGIGIDYTRAAMLIRIPPYHERYSGTTESKKFWEDIKSDRSEHDDYDYDDSDFSYPSDDEMEYDYDEDDDEEDDDDDEKEDEDEDGEEQTGQESTVGV